VQTILIADSGLSKIGTITPRSAHWLRGFGYVRRRTDARPTAVENAQLRKCSYGELTLSLNRAESVKSLGMGETQPVAGNGSQSGRQQNRRVEIIIENPPSAALTSATP
jgi:hypothetical protein